MRIGDRVLVVKRDAGFTGRIIGVMPLRCDFLRLRPLVVIRDDSGATRYASPLECGIAS